MLFNFFVFIKEDSIMYNISKEKYPEALNLIDKVYDPSEDRNEILEELKKQCQKADQNKSKNQSKEPYCTALFGKKHRKGTIVSMIITSLVQQAAINVMFMYSNRIVTNINTKLPDDEKIAANISTVVIGFFAFLGTIGSFCVVRRNPRRSVFIWGQLGVAICLGMLSLFIYLEKG